jgi:hypothetical protein
MSLSSKLILGLFYVVLVWCGWLIKTDPRLAAKDAPEDLAPGSNLIKPDQTAPCDRRGGQQYGSRLWIVIDSMILPQVHLVGSHQRAAKAVGSSGSGLVMPFLLSLPLGRDGLYLKPCFAHGPLPPSL